ncbi:hypothetical protein MASR2M36_37370 [Providencia sp.]
MSLPCNVAVELMIVAIVPGPAVLGIARGTKAMLGDSWRFLGTLGSSSVDAVESSLASLLGNSIPKPINATINPPAIRSPGIEIPNVVITTCPA